MIDTVSYQKITTYPLGEYKRKALQARYQYKCDTFTLVEDGSDYITSIILQSAKRKDSIIIVDPCEKLYSEARAFLREENYNVNCFSDKYYSTAYGKTLQMRTNSLMRPKVYSCHYTLASSVEKCLKRYKRL